jgi:hypothetical protein
MELERRTDNGVAGSGLIYSIILLTLINWIKAMIRL